MRKSARIFECKNRDCKKLHRNSSGYCGACSAERHDAQVAKEAKQKDESAKGAKK